MFLFEVTVLKIMVKLINTLAFLKENYANLDVLHGNSPSYLNTLTGKCEKVLLLHICKFIEPKNHTEAMITPTVHKKISIDDEEIEGSPLEDSCSVPNALNSPIDLPYINPWEDVENYSGLNVDTARSLLNEILAKRTMAHDQGSLWMLVDAKDDESTVFLELEAELDWFSRGVARHRGEVSKIDIPSLVRSHSKMIKDPVRTEIFVDTFYTFFNNTTLKFTNTDDSSLQSVNFLNKSQVVLYQSFNHQVKSLGTDLMNQMLLLNKIFNTIVDFKEEFDGDDDAKEPVYACGVEGIENDFMQKRLMKILLNIPELTEVHADEKTQSLLETFVRNVKDRPLLNTTDQLWDTLKLCGSFKELKQFLQFLFTVAAKSKVVNMPTPSTKLGELIRDVSERRIAIPHLSGSQPLELLLEIGLEKITRDYEYIFVESQICGASDLKVQKKGASNLDTTINYRKSLLNAKPVRESTNRKTFLRTNEVDQDESELGFQNSRFNQNEIELKLSRLAQVHFILEHLLLLQLNLSLNSIQVPVAETLLREEPQELKTLLKMPVHRIEVTIDDCVKEAVEGKRASAKRVSIKSANKFKKLESVHFFSTDPLLPPQQFSHIFTKSSNVDSYWHVSYLKIGNLLK